MANSLEPNENLAEALASAYPELTTVREAAGGEPVYLVGGAVRDLLLKRGRADIDLVIEGDAADLATRLGAGAVSHERFATAKVKLGDHEIDIAGARAETYSHPGALPEVRPAHLAEDLGRRDFTINAMAIPLLGEPELIDPHNGRADLAAGLLRVLHPRSFVDDPTRALRAARYAARFDFALDPQTAKLLRETNLDSVSLDRREAELGRLAAEDTAPRAFELLSEWGLAGLRPGGVKLSAKVAELLASPPWSGIAEREPTLLAAAFGPAGAEEDLAAARPECPSAAVELARVHGPIQLALARAMGAEWLDRYISEWRSIGLEIDGDDLITRGVEQGPAIGRGLEAALRLKLDGEITGRDQELEAALEAASEE